MTSAPAKIAPMKYLHANPNIKSIYKQTPYPYPNPPIKLNPKPYFNPNPDSLEKSRAEQMSCHHMEHPKRRKKKWKYQK